MNDLEGLHLNYPEDNRLEKDNVHQTEYIISRYWLNNYLHKDSKILEIGAAKLIMELQ
ncbi:MAG TPA: hypothetical protein PK737_03170 [Bacilli bacterium]|nr:hypothetical protein [Bacilli bacterium]